jgi:5-methylcytosine-specific restriction enzyme subunit McrC
MQPGTPFTLFENDEKRYFELGWDSDDARIELLEKLNDKCGTTLLRLGRYTLKATQYVGMIRIGKDTIQILPKIDYKLSLPCDNKKDEKTISATSNLMTMLAYAYRLKIHPLESTHLKQQRGDWFEWLTYLFASELYRQLTLGVERSYIDKEEELPFIRGKWLISRQYAHHSTLLTHFEVRYAEYSAETILNHVFITAINRLLHHTRVNENFRLLLAARNILYDVTFETQKLPEDYRKLIHFTRLNKRFETAYSMADLFLQGSVAHFSAGDRNVTAFVFDMNQLFEQFVTEFLLKHQELIFRDTLDEVQIVSQAKEKPIYLLKQVFPNKKDVFRLKPDLMIWNKGRISTIADIKYKQLDVSKRNFGIQEDDSYQMLAYTVAFDCDRAVLIYPKPKTLTIEATYRVRNRDTEMRLAFINLHQPLDKQEYLIRDLKTIFRFLHKEVIYA